MDGISIGLTHDVRQCLRIKHNYFDTEISDLIAAARSDLQLGGIIPKKVNDDKDALIKRAIICYVKAEFGFDNSDAEKYRTVYSTLKKHLMLSTEYITEEE